MTRSTRRELLGAGAAAAAGLAVPAPLAAFGRQRTHAADEWQPLSWMTSTWRAVRDPAVGFAYDVTPMLVGNLGDLSSTARAR